MKQWLLGCLGIGKMFNDMSTEQKRIEEESQSRDKNALDLIRLNHESLLRTIEERVENHLAYLESPRERYAACPTCGKSFNLTSLGVLHNTRSITLVCDNCSTHMEIRPSFFWNKIEVEKR